MDRRARSDWAIEAFGTRVDALRERIPAALAEAHRRARAGHDAGQSKNLRVYGTGLWEFQHEELVAAVSSVGGATVAKFGGYELPIVSGKVLFPLRYTDRAGVGVEEARLPVPVSPQQERLFGAHALKMENPHPFLDESWAGLELPEDYEAFPQLGDDTELIVIAYACGLEAGLLHIEWGRAEHVGDGELRWGDHSPLPLPSTVDKLVSVGHGGAQRFDTGDAPGLALDLRDPGDRELNRPPQTERHPDQHPAQENDHA